MATTTSIDERLGKVEKRAECDGAVRKNRLSHTLSRATRMGTSRVLVPKPDGIARKRE